MYVYIQFDKSLYFSMMFGWWTEKQAKKNENLIYRILSDYIFFLRVLNFKISPLSLQFKCVVRQIGRIVLSRTFLVRYKQLVCDRISSRDLTIIFYQNTIIFILSTTMDSRRSRGNPIFYYYCRLLFIYYYFSSLFPFWWCVVIGR